MDSPINSSTMKTFWRRLHNEVMYFIDDYYDNAFKIDHANKKYLAKRSGEEPFEFYLETEKFELAIIPSNEVTEQEYLDY